MECRVTFVLEWSNIEGEDVPLPKDVEIRTGVPWIPLSKTGNVTIRKSDPTPKVQKCNFNIRIKKEEAEMREMNVLVKYGGTNRLTLTIEEDDFRYIRFPNANIQCTIAHVFVTHTVGSLPIRAGNTVSDLIAFHCNSSICVCQFSEMINEINSNDDQDAPLEIAHVTSHCINYVEYYTIFYRRRRTK